MMKPKIFIIIISLVSLTLASCKKEEKKTIEEFSMDALINDAWMLTLNDSNTSTNLKTGNNVYYAVQDCQKDDVYAFSKSNELFIDFKNTVCNPSENSKSNFVFDKTNRKITIAGVTYTVLELSEKRLKYTVAVPTASGVNNIIYLFEHF
ncbi:hypothetical protein [Mucilaginibacter sp. PAMB04168]|uniref:hypothetical protein n=1 Tax=Mucilaginibacter sp. PAMB04168 TaxID=3138567 RepID=UPI0031F60C34